jgi:hypothetical protein
MPDPAPTPPTADRNLLFGILALQMDFIGRDDLIAAMSAWVLDKGKPLGQILVEPTEARSMASRSSRRGRSLRCHQMTAPSPWPQPRSRAPKRHPCGGVLSRRGLP